ncbi:TetR/AcrR family transcriptional regulator [Peteryoungia algae]|uniref:TetR/AcrR family transcriptional regulator n=1 Tax=Peteryoungia algae TaxID=2919917 RepID=A0ABT0D2K1_9HYPH|nr:TetR/AcrR family transcriptional regulator [Rhizobium sp. SSM4.3]MCJ8239646.1 TetR/AcrR family transcriptional regulator [Rhizobium sp. SSM4.3]
MARQKSYHHGDLRQALIDTGLTMLEEHGLEGLTLRKLAARVGVSHAAPEHHFPSLRHLMTAFAVEGFRQFAASMRSAMAVAPDDPAGQLRAASRGYLAFASSRPHLFRLMFTASRLDWDDPAIGPTASAAHAVLVEISVPVAKRMKLDTPEGRAAVEQLVWSQIHGHAHLMIDGKLQQGGGGGTGCEPFAAPLDLASVLLPE